MASRSGDLSACEQGVRKRPIVEFGIAPRLRRGTTAPPLCGNEQTTLVKTYIRSLIEPPRLFAQCNLRG